MKKGTHHSAEAREKIGQANLGHDTTKNLGNFARKGNVPWNKGIKYSSEMKARLDTSGLSKTGFNQKHSAESRAKMSKSQKGLKRPNISERNKKWVGELAPNWKGGITEPNQAERGRFKREVQKKVFERDNYTCVRCHAKGNLQVDHIKSWKDYPELRFDLSNCRTLCIDCHYLITFGRPKPSEVKAWGHNFSQLRLGG